MTHNEPEKYVYDYEEIRFIPGYTRFMSYEISDEIFFRYMPKTYMTMGSYLMENPVYKNMAHELYDPSVFFKFDNKLPSTDKSIPDHSIRFSGFFNNHNNSILHLHNYKNIKAVFAVIYHVCCDYDHNFAFLKTRWDFEFNRERPDTQKYTLKSSIYDEMRWRVIDEKTKKTWNYFDVVCAAIHYFLIDESFKTELDIEGYFPKNFLCDLL